MSLQEEINQISQHIENQQKLLRQKTEELRQEEYRKRDERMKVALTHIDSLLAITHHDRTSCSDEDPSNYGSASCPRCVLLFAKKNGYFNDDVEIRVSITKPD